MQPYGRSGFRRVVALMGAAFLSISLINCGGGGGGSSPHLPPTSAPAPTPTTGSLGPASTDSWPMYRFRADGSNDNETQTTITPATVGSLKQAWSWTNPNAVSGRGIFAQPIVENGLVYVADMSGYVTALSEKTGTQVWQFTPQVPDSFISTPLYLNGQLWVASFKNYIYVLDAQSGALVHTYTGPASAGSFEGSPIYANGLVYIGETNYTETPTTCITNDQLFAIDPLAQAVVATATLTPPGTTGATIWASPIADGSGDVFAASGNECSGTAPDADSVIAFDQKSLAVIWAHSGPPSVQGEDLDFGASPVFLGNTVVDGAKDGNVYAFNRTTGALQWSYTGPPLGGGSVIGSPSTDGNVVVVPFNAGPTPATGGGIEAFNGSGKLLWSLVTGSDQLGFGVLASPTISQSMVFVGYPSANCSASCDGIAALDLQTGKQLWRAPISDWIDGAATVTSGGLFFGTLNNGTVYRFTPRGAQ